MNPLLIRNPSSGSRVRHLRRYVLLGVLSLPLPIGMIGCAGHSFPVLRPSSRLQREEISRMRAQEYFVKGRDYDRRGLDQMAERFYEMAHELDPKSEVLRRLLAEKYIVSGKYPRALLTIRGDRTIEELSPEEQKVVAHLYLKMGEYADAAALFERLPTLTGAEWWTLGLIYESLRQWDKAIVAYRTFLQQEEEDRSFEVGMKVAELHRRAGRFALAESIYVALDSLHDNHGLVLKALGGLMIDQGDTARAIDFFKTALVVDSADVEAMRSIAQLFVQQENFGEAIKYYEAIYLSGDLPALYGRSLALLYYYNKQYDQAEVLLKRLLADAPADYELHYYLGLVFSAQENFETATIELEKAITLKRDFVLAWQSLCYIDIRQKRWEKALSTARRFAARMENSAEAWRMLGYVQSARKEYGASRDALLRAVALDSLYTQGWFELGSAQERLGEIEKAADAFRTILRRDSLNDMAANYLGYMWAERGVKLDSAKLLIERALRQDPDNGAYLDSYAWVFYKLGDTDNALTYILRALEKIADDAVIYEHYGDILVAAGRRDEALKAYRASIDIGGDTAEAVAGKIRALEAENPASFGPHDGIQR